MISQSKAQEKYKKEFDTINCIYIQLLQTLKTLIGVQESKGMFSTNLPQRFVSDLQRRTKKLFEETSEKHNCSLKFEKFTPQLLERMSSQMK